MLTRFLLTLTLASFALTARADVTPPEVSQCAAKQVGASCDQGVCADGTCSKLDYANWNRDASSAPPTAQYACVKCVAKTSSGDAGGGKNDKDSGCQLGGDARSLAALALALGFAMIARRRRA